MLFKLFLKRFQLFLKQALVFTCLEILWEKEKLLVTSNFSIFYSVFYPFQRTFFFAFSSYLVLLSVDFFSLDVSKFYRFGKGLKNQQILWSHVRLRSPRNLTWIETVLFVNFSRLMDLNSMLAVRENDYYEYMIM